MSAKITFYSDKPWCGIKFRISRAYEPKYIAYFLMASREGLIPNPNRFLRLHDYASIVVGSENKYDIGGTKYLYEVSTFGNTNFKDGRIRIFEVEHPESCENPWGIEKLTNDEPLEDFYRRHSTFIAECDSREPARSSFLESAFGLVSDK